MKRKIIFSGCSFTWGQSLWMYEDIPNLPNAYQWTQLNQEISEDILETRKKYRFPNLICNSLGNYEEYVKTLNGGTDEESVDMIEMILGDKEVDKHLIGDELNAQLVDAIVFQTTQQYRSSFKFEYKNRRFKLYSEPSMKNISKVDEWVWNDGYGHYYPIPSKIDNFYNYCIDNGLSPEDFAEIHLTHWVMKIKKVLKKYYDKGKKVFLLSWTDEYLKKIKQDDFLKSIFVPLHYDNKEFDCINDLYNYNEEMRIDKHIKNRDMGFDEHPSSICHQVIANSILKKWNEKEI